MHFVHQLQKRGWIKFRKGQKSVNFRGAKLMYRDHQGKKFFIIFLNTGDLMAPWHLL